MSYNQRNENDMTCRIEEGKQMQAKKEVSRASREYKYMYINDRNIRAIYIRNLNILVINTFKESKNGLIYLR